MRSLAKQIKTTEEMIKDIEQGYGKDKCPGYYPGCPRCDSQVTLGWLEKHLDLLKWDGEDEKQDKKGK